MPLVLQPIGSATHRSYGLLVPRVGNHMPYRIGSTTHRSYYPIVRQPIGPTHQSKCVARFIGPMAYWSYDPLSDAQLILQIGTQVLHGPLALRPAGPTAQ